MTEKIISSVNKYVQFCLSFSRRWTKVKMHYEIFPPLNENTVSFRNTQVCDYLLTQPNHSLRLKWARILFYCLQTWVLTTESRLQDYMWYVATRSKFLIPAEAPSIKPIKTQRTLWTKMKSYMRMCATWKEKYLGFASQKLQLLITVYIRRLDRSDSYESYFTINRWIIANQTMNGYINWSNKSNWGKSSC